MRYGRLIRTSLLLFLVALAWNGLLHGVALAEVDAEVRHLYRPDLAGKAWLSLVLTGGLVAVFVVGHRRFVRSGSIAEGARYGLMFAVLAGLLVDLNQYVLYPIPAKVALLWFAGGMVEFTLYGVLASLLLRPRAPREVVSAWVEAFNRKDARGLASMYAEDAVNHQVAESPVEGRAAILAMFETGFASAEMVCIVEALFQDGEWAILEWRDPLGLRGCGFFHVVDGKIVFQRGYWDKLSFLRQHHLPIPTE